MNCRRGNNADTWRTFPKKKLLYCARTGEEHYVPFCSCLTQYRQNIFSKLF